MFYTDPKTKKPTSFRSMLVKVFSGEVWLVLLGRSGAPVKAVPGKTGNAMACYKACKARGLVAPMGSRKGEAFLAGAVPEGKKGGSR